MEYDERKYKGNKKNNKYEGRGILQGKVDSIIYNSYFKNGEYEGFERLYNGHELIYIGYFKNNKYHGKGILYSKKQIIYEGNFLDGQYNEIGIEYRKNGKRKTKICERKTFK